jgi:hypothetical protein
MHFNFHLKYVLFFAIALIAGVVYGQTQTVKGTIKDNVAQYELIGATLKVAGTDPVIGSVTDINGRFVLENVPVGRQTLIVSYIGYKTQTIPNVLVTAGKETILNIQLEESVESLQEVVVTAESDKDIPINDLVKVSARTFSLEEVTRFSGGRNDVARLATSFAGVSAPNDARNDIVVRGNSPNGLLWRIEGIPVATTNHFATLGTTGGPVNALNTNLLRTSDFLTGAFPAEYGNANAAVFDVQYRSGNPDSYEFTGQVSAFSGLEFMAEGPFMKKTGGSFVASYRYGIASLAATGTSAVPIYQDLSFKVNTGQTKLGKFELFGLGGLSEIDFLGDELDENDLFANPNEDAYVDNQLGLLGLSHTARLSKNTLLKSVVGFSANGNDFLQYNYLTENDVRITRYRATEVDNMETRITVGSTMNSKLNSRWSLRTGFLTELYRPEFNTMDRDNQQNLTDEDGDGIPDEFVLVNSMDEQYTLTQLFGQAVYKFSDQLEATFGLHSQYLDLEGQTAIEPRAAVSWQVSGTDRISLAYGLHAQIAPAPVLFFEERLSDGNYAQTNRDLDFMRSHHLVLGYDKSLGAQWRVKSEAYVQFLYDVPVEQQSSSYSVVNEGSDFVFDSRGSLVNEGTGRNYGIELTLEKFFSQGYYLLTTGSVFNSTYEGSDGIRRSTAFNSQYVFNALFGKEWKFGENDRNAFTFDTKFTTSGGQRFTPIDLEATRASNGFEVLTESQAFSQQYDPYLRWDVKFGVRLNSQKRNVSHQFFVDLQNVTNRENEFVRRYNEVTDEINVVNQIGFFPDVMYRIQF